MTFVKAYIGETPLFEAGSAGATILKTGQTVSYATGDDGDWEAGRAVDFFTLASNNPFGNTNRFTALNGTQTYTNDIVIDWSTYNNQTVLGYYRGDVATNRLWDDAIAWANNLTIVGFSGWRLTNIKELLNLANYEIGIGVLTYPPISRTTQSHWTSTTTNNNSAIAYTMSGSVGAVSGSSLKASSSNRTIACRDFNVTGTTLT